MLRHVLGLVVITHDRRDVAVDVVGVAHVEVAQRVGVPLGGMRDRAARVAGGRVALAGGAPDPEPSSARAGMSCVGGVHVPSRVG